MRGSVDSEVREHARRRPDHVAVLTGDAALTYAELMASADALSSVLRAEGTGPDVPVGLCLPRSAAMVVGALGILGAGGAYVALDPGHPPARLAAILAESGARLVLGASGVPLPKGVTRIAATGHPAARFRPAAPHAAALAYLIYTSGSTGRPKGVMVAHAELRHLVDWHHRAFGLTATDRVAQLASPGFDASVWDLWSTLTAGATLCVPDEEIRLDPTALRDWLVAERITVTFAPSGLAEELIALPWPRRAPLRLLLTGGDVLRRRPPPGLPFTLVNNYGITEATVVSTSGPVPADGEALPSIGRPIDRVRAHVVDEQLRPVPPGTVGQLLLGGAGLARGYAGRPAATASRFVPDHLGDRPGARLLRTGDLVRRSADGELTFVGRADDQLSRNGLRVEPGEVVAALQRHSAVRAAVVVAEPDRAQPRLLAYLQPASGERPGRDELAAFLATTLPAAMVPHEYLWLTEFPLTANGKLDHKMLPPPPPPGQDTGPVSTADDAGPRTELEAALVPIVADVLDLTTVAADANFFQIGGHSLLGAQLVMRLRERYDVELSLRFLFANPTVRSMAAGIEELVRADITAMSEEQARELLVLAERTGEAR
ncbi:non-ribosomal peptide synthetase [Amycolatopsis mediterranei]|uniref:non-ribosomal peptide synthetase n=1 Tax=Amycolatopsis mediterranei TaxID=33910 RepID=UPI003422396F